MHNRIVPIIGLSVLMLHAAGPTLADGTAVDKVYDPYVNALERELEYRFTVQNDSDERLDGVQIHRAGFKKSWTDRFYAEVYLIGEKTREHDLSVEAYELEFKWQLTEQGEYWADWGLLFELETEHGEDTWEYATTALVAKEWGRWVTTANLRLIYEWGDDIGNEWETAMALQGRYRLTRGFEPALEFYTGQDTQALGPVFVGDIRLGGRKKLHWELGVVFGLDSVSPDQTFRGMLEFEF